MPRLPLILVCGSMLDFSHSASKIESSFIGILRSLVFRLVNVLFKRVRNVVKLLAVIGKMVNPGFDVFLVMAVSYPILVSVKFVVFPTCVLSGYSLALKRHLLLSVYHVKMIMTPYLFDHGWSCGHNT